MGGMPMAPALDFDGSLDEDGASSAVSPLPID
jgi:hypothetical protein